MIVILIPTRGFTFTETDIFIDEVQQEFDLQVIRTYDKKIPEAHNSLVEAGLKTKAEYFFFLEEDVVPTLDQFRQMVNRAADICFVDYAVNGWACATNNKHGDILWCGLGCTLIKRKVFETLTKPWFRTDWSLRLNDMKWVKSTNKYGGHDIWFGDQARKVGFKIIQIPGECKHLQIVSLGQVGQNDGRHKIIVRPNITQHNVINYS